MKDSEIRKFFREMSGTYTGVEAMETEARALKFLAEKSPGYEWRIDWKSVPAEGGRRFLFRPKGILAFPKTNEKDGGQ